MKKMIILVVVIVSTFGTSCKREVSGVSNTNDTIYVDIDTTITALSFDISCISHIIDVDGQYKLMYDNPDAFDSTIYINCSAEMLRQIHSVIDSLDNYELDSDEWWDVYTNHHFEILVENDSTYTLVNY